MKKITKLEIGELEVEDEKLVKYIYIPAIHKGLILLADKVNEIIQVLNNSNESKEDN